MDIIADTIATCDEIMAELLSRGEPIVTEPSVWDEDEEI